MRTKLTWIKKTKLVTASAETLEDGTPVVTIFKGSWGRWFIKERYELVENVNFPNLRAAIRYVENFL